MHPFEINGRTYFLDQLKQDLPTFDLTCWLQQQPLYPKVFWKERDGQITRAAVGSLVTFSRIPQFSGTIPYEIRLYGGIRFAKKYPPNDDTWQRFSQVSFWLPQIELSQNRGKTEAVFHFLNENPSLEASHKQFDVKIEPPSSKTYPLLNRHETPNFETWQKGTQTVLQAISSGELNKLVLARKTRLQFSQPISPWPLLRHLIEKATHATLFAFQLSPSVCFLGATPEKLFERVGNVLNADAIAATRPRGKTVEEDSQFEQELLHDSKELREFNIVKEFLETAITPFSKERRWEGPDQILKTSHVQHIHNRLNAVLKNQTSDAELIDALHPTPALGGFPRKPALSLLRQIEPFDRGWYGAPIGVISPSGASLYVAIRSALIRHHSLDLFAGTGVVDGSTAEYEWDELEQKIRPFTEMFLK
jgi:menaquinone-specific isochorismate synthase